MPSFLISGRVYAVKKVIGDLPARAQLADQFLTEGLPAFLAAQRDEESKGWDSISHELSSRTDRRIEVTGVTIQAWAEQLAEETAR